MDEFKERLVQLRKTAQLTQDALAAKLGVTYQAVSKWETGSCYPDVTLLPKIAGVFGTTVDYLLGGVPPETALTPAANASSEPSADLVIDSPGDLEIRVFCKGRPVADARVAGTVTVRLLGRVRDISCEASLVCEEVEGDVAVQGSLDCRGDIGGDVSVNGNLRCKGDIGGDASVGGNFEGTGDIGGDVSAGGNLVCTGDIGGDVSAGGGLVCQGDIGGDVSAQQVSADRIDGDVNAADVRRKH
jgi:transcriptional regulator with XRE-family HTH domain/cytoskeletal protein CcmA (bactofilin family)